MSLADKIAPEIQARMLLDGCVEFLKDHEFLVGQLVQLKPAMAGGFRLPGKGSPMAVVEHIDVPVAVMPNSAGFGDKMTIRVLLLDSDGDMAVFAFDGRYLEPYAGKVAN